MHLFKEGMVLLNDSLSLLANALNGMICSQKYCRLQGVSKFTIYLFICCCFFEGEEGIWLYLQIVTTLRSSTLTTAMIATATVHKMSLFPAVAVLLSQRSSEDAFSLTGHGTFLIIPASESHDGSVLIRGVQKIFCKA